MGIINVFPGGGGTNYNIYKVASKPTAAGSENDIAVVTGVDIGDVQLNCAAAPTLRSDGTALVAGDVYIELLASSSAAFNAALDGALYVRPGACYQYSGSAWAAVTAYVYHAGAWVECWDGHVYLAGNEYIAITGGWISVSGGYVTHNAAALRLDSAGGKGWAIAQTQSLIDLTDFKTMIVSNIAKVNNGTSFGGLFGYSKTRQTANSYPSAYGGSYKEFNWASINSTYAPAFDITNVVGPCYLTLTIYNGAIADIGSVQLLR